MPLQDFQKRWLVEQHGLDPSQYTTDDEGTQFIPVNTSAQPSVSPEIVAPRISAKPSSTATSAFAKSAAINALPAVGGGAAAGLTALALPGILSTLGVGASSTGVGALVGIPLIAGAAYLGAKGTGALQSAVLPDSLEQNVAQSAAEHPYAALAGSLATMPLGGLNPNVGNIVKAGGALANLATGMRPTAPAIGNLANVGIGAGIGAGQSIIEGQDAKTVLENAAIGALFNKPNIIGKGVYKFHDPAEIPTLQSELNNALAQRGQTQQQPANISATPGVGELLSAYGNPLTRGLKPLKGQQGYKPAGETIGKYKGDFYPTAEELARQEREGGQPIIDKQELANEQRLEAERQKKIEDFKKAKRELENLQIDNSINEVEKQKQQLKMKLGVKATPEAIMERGISGEEIRPKPDYYEIDPETDKSFPVKLPEIEQGKLPQVTPEESAADLAARQAEGYGDRYSKESDLNRISRRFIEDTSGRPRIQYILTRDPVSKEEPFRVTDFENGSEGWEPTGHTLFKTEAEAIAYIHKEGRVKNTSDNSNIYFKEIPWDSPEHKFSKGNEGQQTRLQQNVTKQLIEQNKPIIPTKKWYDVLSSWGAKFRNITTDTTGIPIDRRTGQPVAGEALLRQGLEPALARINLGKAGADTLPHEQIGHIFFNDLLKSKRPGDVRMIEKGIKIIRNDPDFQNWFKSHYGEEASKAPEAMLKAGIEEYNAVNAGYEFLRRQLNTDKETPFKTWWRDFTSHIKTRYSKYATTEDFQRLLNYRFHNDPAFSSPKNVNVAVGANQEQRLSEKSELPNSSNDYERFQELSAKRTALIKEGKFDTDEFRSIWQEMETIKNRNPDKPGMPPEAPSSDQKLQQSSDLNNEGAEESSYKFKRSSFLPFLTARIDKVEEVLRSPTSKMVKENLHKFAGEADLLSGNIGNKLIAATWGYKPEEIQNVYKYLYDIDNRGTSDIQLTSREQELAPKITEIVREPRRLQQAEGPLVKEGKNYRLAGIKPEGYMFNMLDPKVAYTWAEKPNSPEAKSYDAAYVKHLMENGISQKDALETLADYKRALGNNVTNDPEFGAIRKAEGNGLPWELVDKNFHSAAARYGNRAGRDLAYFKYIQNDPKMLKALNLKDQYGAKPDLTKLPDVEDISENAAVKEALRSVFGIDMPKNPRVMAASRVASNVVMGAGTAARNVLNMPSFIANYVQVKQLPLVAKAIANLNETRVRAFESNAVKANFGDFDAAGYYEGNPNPVINLMNKFSSFLRKYQGRDLSDKFEGSFYYSLGELLATDNIARAKQGNKESLRFINRFGDIVKGGADELLKRDITQDDISRIAKRFVDSARGTYGPEGLPSFAIEGELAPFAALSRFALEKSNTIWKDVIQPAQQGIYGPLLRYTLASLGVGLTIEEANELFTNKRGVEPKINELLASGREDLLLPKAISLLQLASFAGIVSDGAKLVTNMAQGKSLKYNQPLSFPLYTLATETIGGNISDAVGAIQDGQDPFEVMGALATAISTQAVQTMRYVDANVLHPEEAKRKEKFRDVKVFNTLEGNEPPSFTDRANVVADLDKKAFKRTSSPQEAAAMLPALIKEAITKANGNVDKLRSELRSLKQNNYQTMPSPDVMPGSFLRYVNFLKATQGEDVAAERLHDYMKQRSINSVKAAMVPSV